MSKLRFGPGGIPKAVNGDILDAAKWLAENKLGCTELAFVHSTWLKDDKAEALKEIAQKSDIKLTAHGSYYINLNATEEKKRQASRNRVLSACHALDKAGGESVTFHPAYYLKQDPEKVYATAKEQLKMILKEMKEHSLNVRLSPETTGKPTQFGSIEELTRLAQDFSNEIMLCIDFAHLHARSNGEYNTKEEFESVLELVEERLGREGLDNMHIHMSGIHYGPKGEKNHLMIDESDFNIKPLVKTWKEFKIKGNVICESPIMEQDAQYMKRLYEEA